MYHSIFKYAHESSKTLVTSDGARERERERERESERVLALLALCGVGSGAHGTHAVGSGHLPEPTAWV